MKNGKLKVIFSSADMGFRVYHSNYIDDNNKQLAQECAELHKKFISLFPNKNSSANTTAIDSRRYVNGDGYLSYNIFSLAAPSPQFYKIFEDLLLAIADFAPDEKLYMQAWLNYQSNDEVLGWHSHEGYKYHGYISIDPKATYTDFGDYEIINRPGQIYIGNPLLRHRVINKKKYAGKRTTIGFDLIDPIDCSIQNMGFIPISLAKNS